MRFVERMPDLPDGTFVRYELDKITTINEPIAALICYLAASLQDCEVAMIHVSYHKEYNDECNLVCEAEEIMNGDEFAENFHNINDWLKMYGNCCTRWYIAINHNGRYIRMSGSANNTKISVMSHFECKLNIEASLADIEQRTLDLINKKEI
jgi:hypothetical protein